MNPAFHLLCVFLFSASINGVSVDIKISINNTLKSHLSQLGGKIVFSVEKAKTIPFSLAYGPSYYSSPVSSI